MKLDPTQARRPARVVDPGPRPRRQAGVWATPALDRDMVYVATNGGRLLGIDRDDRRRSAGRSSFPARRGSRRSSSTTC